MDVEVNGGELRLALLTIKVKDGLLPAKFDVHI